MLDSYLIQAKNEAGERISAIIYDKKLGWVIYPSSKAVKDGIERSMAWKIINFGLTLIVK